MTVPPHPNQLPDFLFDEDQYRVREHEEVIAVGDWIETEQGATLVEAGSAWIGQVVGDQAPFEFYMKVWRRETGWGNDLTRRRVRVWRDLTEDERAEVFNRRIREGEMAE